MHLVDFVGCLHEEIKDGWVIGVSVGAWRSL